MVLLLSLAVTMASAASAQTTARPASAYVGRYRYAGTPETTRREMRRMLRSQSDRINPLMRMLAESRLATTDDLPMPFPREIRIGLDGDLLRVELEDDDGDARVYRSRLGYPSERRRGGRLTSTMTQLVRGDRLEQIVEYAGPRGLRRYRIFELDSTGRRLTLTIVMTASGLEAPVRTRLPYRRIEARDRRAP